MLVADLFRASFPDGATRWTHTGIDVSGNQPASIIRDLWNAGRRFDHVVVKATEGSSFRSDEARQQITDARLLGRGTAFYHWCSYRTTPAAEAANVIPYVRELGVPPRSTASPVAVWVDAEDTAYARHNLFVSYTDWTLELVDRIAQALGVTVGIYTAGWWANGRLDHRCADVPLWVADYDDQRTWRGFAEPVMPAAWAGRRAHGWQFTSLGPAGSLDLNVWDPGMYAAPADGFTPQDTGHPAGAPLLPTVPDQEDTMTLLIRDPDTGALYWWDGQTRTKVEPRPGDFDAPGLDAALKRLVDAHPSARLWPSGALWIDVPAHDLALIPVR